MHCQSLEVDDQDGHSEGYTCAPQNVACDCGPESVLRVWENFSNDAARSGGDYRGDYREKPGGGHR